MDNQGDISKNDLIQQQQPTSTSIVSSLTTATPITSEIISDFEPDPKFEITPLERASYDCPEIYGNDNLLEQQEQDEQQHSLSETNDDNSQTSISDQRHMQSPAQEKNQPAEHPEATNQVNVEPPHCEPERLDGPKQDEKSCVTSPRTGNNRGQEKLVDDSPLVAETCLNITPSNSNDCESSKTHRNEAIHVSNNTEVPLIPTTEQAAPMDTPNTDLFGRVNVRNQGTTQQDGSTVRVGGPQQSSNEACMDAQLHPISESDMSHLYSLSQATVDAQMEKVIDNIVELGGAHQFSQSLGHAEDTAKLLESIHREITSERSSIDLIADVASRQQSIEITPPTASTAQYQEAPCSTSVHAQQDPDLTKTDTVSHETQPDVIVAKSNENIPHEEKLSSSSHSKTDDDHGIDAIKIDASQSEVVQQKTELPLVEVQVEPIIEEPAPCSTDEEISEIKPADSEVASLQLEDLDHVVVQPLETTEEKAEEMHLEPIVEEATSTDEDLPMGHAGTALASETNDGQSSYEATKIDASSKLKELPADTVQEERMEVDERKSPEPARRRSGRKVKVVEKAEFETSMKRVRRSEKGNQSVAAPENQPVVETGADATEIKTEDLEVTPVVPEAGPAESNEEVAAKDSNKATTSGQEVEEAKASTAEPQDKRGTRSRRELRDRLSKVLRPKEATKRGHEEESPATEPPKIEPPKKQVRKSRGSSELSPYEAAKKTPLIKLPNYRSRQTISISDPITRLNKRFEPTAPISSRLDTDKFSCYLCEYTTSRLANLIWHSSKGYCKGKQHASEVMKADIIRQQQQPKAKRRSIR